jgi:4-hydroxy-tetrahydrodipicolinate reductase
MNLAIMVNGMPGKMAIEVAQVVLQRGYTLVPFSLTGPGVEEKSISVENMEITLLTPDERDAAYAEIKEKWPNMIAVDYTHPTAVNANAEFYVAQQTPFVMGTTGGDREALQNAVDDASLACVIAPNMAKQIVAFQAMMEYAAKSFPGVFSGWKLSVKESHQKTKADTSGTAKAVVASFNEMGLDYKVDQIEKVRTESEQMEAMKVPEAHLNGHAFHTYSVDSADDSVHFEFQHNVCGRSIYAEGTVDAVVFLAEQLASGKKIGRLSMIDVLQAGAMG